MYSSSPSRDTLINETSCYNSPNSFCQGRLTLTSGVPVTTSDQTAKTTLYFTPFRGNQVSLWSGCGWKILPFEELSIVVPATISTMYDVFVYNDNGAGALELAAWTDDSTRATPLLLFNGVYLKSTALSRRYVGSFRTTGVSGETEDSVLKRYVWNYHYRTPRKMIVQETTSSWTYGSTTVRRLNNNSANQLEIVCGISEDTIQINGAMEYDCTVTGGRGNMSVGVNSITGEPSTAIISGSSSTLAVADNLKFFSCIVFPSIGRTYFAALENTDGSTITFIGRISGNLNFADTGLSAVWNC